MCRALIVEDDITLARFFSHWLELAWDIDSDTANTFEDADRLLTEKTYDIYIIDYKLDNTRTGVDLLMRHNADPDKVFIMSGYSDVMYNHNVPKVTTHKPLIKPVLRASLCNAIKELKVA